MNSDANAAVGGQTTMPTAVPATTSGLTAPIQSVAPPTTETTATATNVPTAPPRSDNDAAGGAVRMEGMDFLERTQKKQEDSMSEADRRMKEEELSFYTNSENDHGDDNIWGLLSGVGGNIYEWYDFAVYGLLAPEIGACFFPQSKRELQLINSFGVYLAAFLMRPIGAVMFGEIGDRLVGRKYALVFSIVLITIPSVLMGLLPGYDSWGAVSPVLLVLLRMLQGLSVGGQLAGSYVLAIEQSSSRTRGFRGSICDASSVGGFLMASAVTSAVRLYFTNEQVDEWAWRVPFWFSLLLAPILYQVVKNTEESKYWEERNEQRDNENMVRESEHVETRPAFLDLLDSPFRRRQLAGMVGTLSAVASTFYILFLWTPVYLSELRGLMSQADADMMNFVVVGCYIVFLIISGQASDKLPHRMDLVRMGLPGIIVACPTMFGMFESESWWGILFGQLQLGVCLSMVQGCMAAWEVELWMNDPTLSFTGVAIGHNVASCVFGGTMPLVATALFYRASRMVSDDNDIWYHSLLPRLIPGLYISFLGFVSFYCISLVVRHPHDVRTGGSKLRAMVEKENQKYRARKRQHQTTAAANAGTYNPPVTEP